MTGLVFFGVFSVPVNAASLLRKAEVRLVRAEGSPQIYAIVKGHKYFFRSPSSLASYAYGNSRVEIIDQAALGELPSVTLIKSSLGPRVYLLDEISGQKLWFAAEESFIKSGANWSDIFEVSSFDARLYANARLARLASEPTVYYLDWENKTRAPIASEEVFLANGFKWSEVVAAPSALLEGYALSNAFDADTPLAPPPNGVTLFISGASRISASTFPSATIRHPVWTLGLKAENGDITVRSFSITKRGFARDIDIEALALLDEKGFLLASPQRFVNGAAVFSFKNPVVVPAGETRILIMAANFARLTDSAQTTFYLSINDPSQITASAPLRGEFPLTSPVHTVVSAVNLLGSLSVEAEEISSSARNVIVGSSDQVLNRWRFSLIGGSEDALIEQIIFALIGNGRPADFGGYELVDEQNKVAAKNFTVSGQSVMIDFGANPYRLRRGETKTLTLRADVLAGLSTTSQFIIENEYDIFAKGAVNGYALMTAAGPVGGGFPIGAGRSSGFNAIYIEPGKVLIDLNSQSPSGAITRGAREAVLAAFDVKPLGQTLRWEKISLGITTSAPHTSLTESLTIRIKGGAALGTVEALSAMDQVRSVSLSNPPTIQSGKIVTVEIVGNVNSNASTADRYQVAVSGAEFVIPNSIERITFDGTVSGAIRAVQEITLRARYDPNFKPSPLAPAGVKNFKIGRYLFQPSAGERVRIDQVTLTAIGTTPVRFSDGYSNLRLAGKVIAAPSGNPHIFALGAEINAGSEAGFDLVVDTTTTVDGEIIQFNIQDIIAVGTVSKTRVPAQLENISTPAIAFKESRAMFSLNNNFSGGQTAKSSSSVIASFTVSAEGAEDMAIPEMIVTEASSSSGLSVTRGYKNLRLTDASNGRTISRTVVNPVSGAGGNLLSGGPTLKPGQTLTFNVVIDSTAAASGDSIQTILAVVKAAGRTTNLTPVIIGLPVTGQIVEF